MLDETIEELTKILIKMHFKDKEEKEVEYIKIKRTDLVRFSIKLIKFIKQFELTNTKEEL